MNTSVLNGYTRDLTNEQKAANIIARLCAVVDPDEAGRIVAECVKGHMEISDQFVRDLDYLTRQAEIAANMNELKEFDEDLTVSESIQSRIAHLEAELQENPPAERAQAIIDELAEIECWQARQMDFGEPDARICLKHGEQL